MAFKNIVLYYNYVALCEVLARVLVNHCLLFVSFFCPDFVPCLHVLMDGPVHW